MAAMAAGASGGPSSTDSISSGFIDPYSDGFYSSNRSAVLENESDYARNAADRYDPDAIFRTRFVGEEDEEEEEYVAETAHLDEVDPTTRRRSSRRPTSSTSDKEDSGDQKTDMIASSAASPEGCCGRCLARLSNCWRTQVASTKYIAAEAIRQPKSYVIGWFTLFLTVFFVALLINAVVKSPLIFFRLAEVQTGEQDVILTPGLGIVGGRSYFPSAPLPWNIDNPDASSDSPVVIPLMNATVLEADVDKGPPAKPLVEGISSRWLLPVQYGRSLDPTEPLAPVIPWSDEDGIIPTGNKNEVSSAYALGIDQEREERMGLGRSWDYPPVPEHSAFFMRSITNQIRATVGDSATLVLRPLELLGQLGVLGGSNFSTSAPLNANSIRAILTIFAPGTNWTEVYAQPLFDATDPNSPIQSFSLANALDWNGLMAPVFSQPLVAPILATQTSVAFSLTLRQLNELLMPFLQAQFMLSAESPWVARGERGRRVSFYLTDRAPPGFGNGTVGVFPLSDDAITWTFRRADDNLANPLELDAQALDDSFHAALVSSGGKSGLTIGNAIAMMGGPTLETMLLITKELTVGRILTNVDGKISESIGAVAVMENKDVIGYLRACISKNLRDGVALSYAPGVTISVDMGPIISQFTEFPVTFVQTVNGSNLAPIQITLVQILTLLGQTPAQSSAFVEMIAGGFDRMDEKDYTPTMAAMYRHRERAYLSNELQLEREMIAFTNSLAEGIGIDYPATFTMPLLEALRNTMTIRTFLDNIFAAVIVLIVGLSALLIYSLMLNDVETRTYEYGMLRALGMPKSSLIQILLSKSFFFTAVGLGTGYLAAFIIGIPVTNLITGFADVDPSYALGPIAAVTAFFVALIMPILANLIPIMRALSKTLRDSLDIYHHVINDITVRMIRLSDLGLDLWQTAISLLMVVVGFITYYLVPYAFINRKMDVFLGILNGILMGMLLGLCILAQIVQPFLERFFLWILTRPVHPQLNALCRKNLGAHRGRNSKTALMLVIALAFVVFAGVMFELQGASLADNLRVFIGAPLVVLAPSLNSALNEEPLTEYLNEQVQRTNNGETGAVLTSFSFISFPLSRTGITSNTRLSNLAFTPEQSHATYAIQPSFYDSIYNEYYEDVDRPSGSSSAPGVKRIFTDPNPGNNQGRPKPILTGYSEGGLLDPINNQTEEFDSERMAFIDSSYGSPIAGVCAEGLRNVLSVNPDRPAGFRFTVRAPNLQFPSNESGTAITAANNGNLNPSVTVSYFARLASTAKHVPGFFFSSYSTLATATPFLITEADYVNVLNQAVDIRNKRRIEAATAGARGDLTPEQHYTRAPKERLIMQVKSGSSSAQRRDLLAGIRGIYTDENAQTTDTENTIDSIQFAIDMLNIFFTIVGVLAMVLCFVILWLSFTANVQENAWEFGVLRAIGLTKTQVIMIYIYEAMSIVLACIVLGTLIGLTIAITLTVQFNLFTEMKFRMLFPSTLLVVQIIMAVVVAIVASFLPAYAFIKRTISEILRRS